MDSNLPEDNQNVEAPTVVEMPEIDPAFGYLLELFFLSGQCMSTGMGLVPLSWQEIDAFIRVNQLDLTLWEIETIKAMSDAYCAEHAKATEPNRSAPYKPEVDDEEEVYVEKEVDKAIAFRETLRAMRKK